MRAELWITTMPGYASTTSGIDLDQAANSIAVVVFMVLLPLGGWVSDRIGRRPTYLFFVVGFAVFALPAYRRLEDSGFGTLLVVELIGVVLLVGNSANVAAIYAELFPVAVRTTGIWIYIVAASVIGVITIVTMPDGARRRELD